MKHLLSIVTLAALAATGLAAEPEAKLARPGKALLSEDFSAAPLGKEWSVSKGEFKIGDGALRGAELEKDDHAGAIRRALPLQDAIIRFDFRLDGAKSFNIGMDPAKGELKKKGHLWSLTVTETGMRLVKAPDKAAAKPKAEPKAEAKIAIPQGEWHTLLVEMKGEQVRAVLVTKDGEAELRGGDPEFSVRKPSIIFRVSGKSVGIDNLKVWEAAP